VILRNALDGCSDPFVIRAGELFFRSQRMTTHQGSLIAADEETIAGRGAAPLSPLVFMLGISAGAELDIVSDDNAHSYWGRSDLFDMALDLTVGCRGLVALGGVIERWVQHMLSIDVAVEPLSEMRDVPLTWYVGLDAEGTRIGDALWHGEDLDEKTQRRVVALARLTFRNSDLAALPIEGDSVYLILAMTTDKVLRMKPQNLLIGLPTRRPAALT
jgi:hypothetical protein